MKYFKNRILIFSLISLFILSSFVSSQNEINYAPGTTVHSASEHDYPPFAVVFDNGSVGGFSVDLLRATLTASDLHVDFYAGQWSDIKQDLADEKIEVLPLVGRSPEREPIYDFTVPYITLYGALFTKQGDKTITSIEDLKGKRVGVLQGDNAEEYARRAKVSDTIITTQTYVEAFEKLSTGDIDAVITQELVGTQLMGELGIVNVTPILEIRDFKQDFTFAVTEGNNELLMHLNNGLSKVITDGTFIEIYDKWIPKSTIKSESQVSEKKEFSKNSIKQKAQDVARQIEIYVTLNPHKTLKDLQNDSYFQDIAVQKVGISGYTAVSDLDTSEQYFTRQPEMVGRKLSEFKEQIPVLWEFFSKNMMGKCVDAGTLYDWPGSDGQLQKKYAYSVCVKTRTADGKQLGVDASTYLSEFETSDGGKQDFSAAKQSITQRALDIGKQIEIYIKAYPDKKLSDLKEDPEFQDIVIQQVGKTGYTFAYDCNTMVNHFHSKIKFLGLNYTTLKDEVGREKWWEITGPSMGCKTDTQGIYLWKDTDGVFREKYKYTRIIPAKTADGVQLAVGASTYLHEYLEPTVTPKDDEIAISDPLKQSVLKNVFRAKNLLYNLLETDTISLKSQMTKFMGTDELKKIFLEKDREKLYTASKKIFDKNKNDYATTHMYFETLDGKVFLRAHNKNIFDDKITRTTFEKSKQTKSWGTGIELGKTAFALRVVHPYTYEGKQIGYIEFGQEIDQILTQMKRQTGLDFAITVKKDYIDADKWESVRIVKRKRNNYDDMQNYIVIEHTDESNILFEGITLDEKQITELTDEGNIIQELKVGEKTFIYSGFNLYDAKGTKVGGIIVTQDVSQFKTTTEKTPKSTLSTTLFIGILVLLSLILLVLLYHFRIIKFSKNEIMYTSGLFLILVVILFLFNAYTTTKNLQDSSIEDITNHMISVADSQQNFINYFIEEQQDKLKIAATHQDLSIQELITITQVNREFGEIFVLNSKGIITASSDVSKIGLNREFDDYFINGLKKTYVKPVYPSTTVNQNIFTVSTPFHEGVLVARIDLEVLKEIVSSSPGLGQTGEGLMAYRNQNGDAVFVGSRKFETDVGAVDLIQKEDTDVPITQALLKHEKAIPDGIDYRNKPVIAVTRYIPDLDIGIVIKIDKQEALSTTKQNTNQIWYFTFGIITAFLIIGGLFNIFLTKALQQDIKEKTLKLQHLTDTLESKVTERTDQLQSLYNQLEQKVEERTQELKAKNQELEVFNKLSVGRELKMVELKKKIKELEEK